MTTPPRRPLSSLSLAAATLAVAVVCVLGASASAQGLLIPRDEGLPALALRQHDVRVTINDSGAVTHVTQVFANNTPRDLEATYYFAVPPGAVTTDFALWMNGRRVAGEVLPRGRAREIYDGIVRRMRDPGLLEYVDGELFQASIYPVPANGEQRVEIQFANVLARQGDVLHYRYPIHESAAREIPQLSVSGTVASSHTIASLNAPYHDVETTIDSDGHSARFGMEQSQAPAGRDFELFIRQTGEDVGFSLLTFDGDDGEAGYFMLSLSPAADLEDLEVLPKQVTFVVDTSGSMSGQKMEQARQMLRQCVDALGNRDTFQLIGFSSGVRSAFEGPVPANRDNRRTALEFVDGLVARGNTNISEALARALQDPASSDRPHTIIFVTDGIPTEGDTTIEGIVEAVRSGISDGDRRVFAFGVGYDVNTRLLDGIARRGRGETGYVRPEDNISDVVGEFFEGIGSPLLTHLEIDFGGARVEDVYPNPLPDLYRGREVTVFGRVRADRSANVTVRGQAAGSSYSRRYGTDFGAFDTADTSFVGNLWARRRIDHLLAELDERGQSQARIDEIVALATRWNIVTPYTSYLAVDPSEQIVQPGPMPRREPWMQPAPLHPPMGPGFDGSARGNLDTDSIQGFGLAGAADEGGGTGIGTVTLGAGQPTSSGRGRGAAPAPSAAPQAAAPAMRARQESTTRATVGRAAVEEELQRESELRSQVVTREAGTRVVAGRSFAFQGGVWVEGAVGSRAVDQRITFMSDAYFNLLRDNPELREVLSLGERVRFLLRGRVYEIVQ